MCLLVLIRGVDPDYPILVGSNRDERRSRTASPPGLFAGAQSRILSPRDRLGGGTWLGINEHRLFAGITNVAGVPSRPLATSRGSIPHEALEARDLDEACERVRHLVQSLEFNAFQLLVSDGDQSWVLRMDGGELEERIHPDEVVVISNEHRPGELGLDVAAALQPGMTAGERLDSLRPILLDEGERSGHRILKRGEDYGTVSSSLIALGQGPLIWRYSSQPARGEYRDYGNLAKRLTS